MKKVILFLLISFCSYSSFATHGMGGEITWSCDGTGNYIFQLKFYRDCNGISGPSTVDLTTNVPGVPLITLNLLTQTDISPVGSNGTGNSPCVTCISGGNGAVEEFVFQSAPTTLPGVPPAAGWAFSWGTCCRSSALSNIAGAGSLGFGLRAVMYPFSGQAAGMCSDNSPYFAERPSVIICTGYPFTYNHLAIDPEMDSLNYSWASPIEDPATVPYPWIPNIPFQAPYSITNQVPGSPTLDQHSGQLSFNAPTGGYFATVIEVDAYKCGVKVAEIYREINIVLINGCSIPGFGINNPPVVPPPFPDSSGNPFMSYDTYVHAGDTVNFHFASTDFDIHPPNLAQIITINASGQQFGAGFTSTTTGCLIPPCATLTPPPPTSNPSYMQTIFYWTTTTAHLGLNYGCVYLGNKYYFVIRANDDFCPANGITNQTISVTVLPNTPEPLVTYGGGQLNCLTAGNYSYQWFLNRYAIGGATSQSYTPLINGNYQVLAVENATGDGNYSAGYSVTNVLGMESVPGVSELSIYPNPSFNGMFQLKFSSISQEDIVISIKDMVGNSIAENSLNNFSGKYSEEIDLSSFSKGIYTLELKTKNGRINKKVILL